MDQINCLRNGDTDIYQQIFARLYEQVYAYLLLKSKDSCTAQELTQVTFIKLWEFRHTLSDCYSLETQIFRIARTCFIDNLRTRAKRRELIDKVSAGRSEVFSYMELPDQERHIHIALASLPPNRRRAFMLSRMEGLSYKEIALKMEISDRTVEKHISMALKQLKKIMVTN